MFVLNSNLALADGYEELPASSAELAAAAEAQDRCERFDIGYYDRRVDAGDPPWVTAWSEPDIQAELIRQAEYEARAV